MKLSEEQEDIIRNCIDAHGLKLKTLRDDVIDHLCCVLEYELGKGKSFDKALDEALNELAPNGLSDLEHKTLFLLNAKRILIMKKLLYLIGFIGAGTLAIGVTLKLLQMSGGNEFFMIGFFALLLVFIPLLAFDRYKVAISKTVSVRLKIILGTIAAIITGLSGLFKVLHLQGAEILLMAGAAVFVFGFLPFLFFTMYKKSVS